MNLHNIGIARTDCFVDTTGLPFLRKGHSVDNSNKPRNFNQWPFLALALLLACSLFLFFGKSVQAKVKAIEPFEHLVAKLQFVNAQLRDFGTGYNSGRPGGNYLDERTLKQRQKSSSGDDCLSAAPLRSAIASSVEKAAWCLLRRDRPPPESHSDTL